jgi:hypothetical protein
METCLPPNNDIRKCLLVMRHSWNKKAFWVVNNKKWRKWCKSVSTLLFNNCYGLPVLTIDTSYPNQVFYLSLVELQTICAKSGLETFLSPNNHIRKCLLDMRHSWIKNAFWDINNEKWRKWCKFVSPFLFNNTYGLPVLTIDTKYPFKYFMFGAK